MFGDNGMISVIICRQLDNSEPEKTWEIDTWLMSCRVLGRKVEQTVLREILLNARAAGVHRIIGIFRPTERNALVRDHYQQLGFTLSHNEPDGGSVWYIDAQTEIGATAMTVHRRQDLPSADGS
jgi:FkbH-like protein